jgi:3-hydroxyisobutyryl-CoA hydrolase
LNAEFRIAARILRSHDFYEGVRVKLVKKSGIADWQPASLDDVEMAKIDAYFEPLGKAELMLPAGLA